MLRGIIHIFFLCLLCAACGGCHSTEAGDDGLSIAFTGDVLLDRGVRLQMQRKGADWLFDSVAPFLRKMDAAVINLECPLTERNMPLNKRFIFRADPSAGTVLRRAGITHAALANNHTIDQGRKGITDTYRNLRKNGIVTVGYGENANLSARPVIIQKGKNTVALFNSVLLPLENWAYLDDRPGINQQSVEQLAESIKGFKRVHPSTRVVVVLHWGAEYQPVPSPIQRKEARCLLRAGADAIIGHHPHIIQKEEYIDSKPVFYSIGNFVFDQRKPETTRARIVRLRFNGKQCDVTVYPVRIKGCRPILEL